MKLYIPIYIWKIFAAGMLSVVLLLLLSGCTWDQVGAALDIIAAPLEPTSQEACEAKGAAWADGQCWATKVIADCENAGGRWMEGECRVPIEID